MRQLTRRQRTAAIVLAVLALGFLTLDLGGGSLRGAHSGVGGAFGSLYRGTDSVLGPVRRWIEGVPSAGTNQSEIDRLEHENQQLRGELANRQADAADATRLAALQGAANSAGQQVLPARVLALGPGQGFDWTVTLDVGRGSGVRAGQTVTDGYGLVGRVLSVNSATSVVLLAADPGSGVGARDERTGEIGVVTGAGPSGFTFSPLKPGAAVRPGDRLVTGPAGSTSFVTGIAIGTVRTVRSGTDGIVHATVTPTTSPTAVDLVGVILTGSRDVAAPAPLHPTPSGSHR